MARQKYSVSPVKHMRFLRRLDLNDHLSEVIVLVCGWYMLRGDESSSARETSSVKRWARLLFQIDTLTSFKAGLQRTS